MSTRKLYVLLPLAIITSLLLSNCAESIETDLTGLDPRFGGVFNYASSSEPISPDTHCQSDKRILPLQALVMENLVTFGEGYSIIPMLAESWEVSHNDTVYTFYLRRGIKFHNGKEMTSDDVITSLERYFSVGYRAHAFEIIESFRALDDYSVRVQISHPTTAFLYNLAMPESAVHIYPAEIIKGRPLNDLTWDDFIGTGPYQLVEHKQNDVTVFSRFEEYQPYPGRRDGLGGAKIAFFDEIHFHIRPDYADRLTGLQEGSFDWIEGKGHDLTILNSDPDLEIEWDEHAGSHHLIFNHAASPTDDLKFRQAIRAVLDIEEFGISVWAGCRQCFRMNCSLWPVFSNYHINDDNCRDLYNQNDLEKAKTLLRESNYDGKALVCSAPAGNDPHINACLYLQEVLGDKLDIDVQPILMESNALPDSISEDESWNFSMMVFPDATEISSGWYTFVQERSSASPGMRSVYRNKEMETAYAHLDTATTYEQRMDWLKDIQRISYEEVIDVKLWDITIPWFHRSNIKGYAGWYVERFYGVWRD